MRLFALRTTPRLAELAADHCWQAGAAGIWESEPEADVVVLRVGVADADAERFVEAVAGLRPIDVTDDEAVALATCTVAVGPPHAEALLTVPPTVFGDGLHPTTAACVNQVVARIRPGSTFLDVGCGSGALSVVAARLGARVTAIDVDPVAVDVTRSNAAANGVSVRASTQPLASVRGRYDLVAANISARAVVELGGELWAHTDARGALVVSGILDDRWPAVRDALGGIAESLTVVDGWVTAVLRHP